MNQRLAELQTKVDEKFQEILAAYPNEIQCGRGCYQCCRAGLTVSKVEQQAIRTFLEAYPDRRSKVRQLSSARIWGEQFCEFLDANGECSIYEVRPVICRSHGAPIKFNENGQLKQDVCTLNFQSLPLTEVLQSSVINLDLLNTLLALINHAECDETSATKRFPLNYSGIVLEKGYQDLKDMVTE